MKRGSRKTNPDENMTQTINNPAESISDSRPRHRFIGSSKNPLFDCLAARFIRSRNRESGRAQNSTLGHRSILVVVQSSWRASN